MDSIEIAEDMKAKINNNFKKNNGSAVCLLSLLIAVLFSVITVMYIYSKLLCQLVCE